MRESGIVAHAQFRVAALYHHGLEFLADESFQVFQRLVHLPKHVIDGECTLNQHLTGLAERAPVALCYGIDAGLELGGQNHRHLNALRAAWHLLDRLSRPATLNFFVHCPSLSLLILSSGSQSIVKDHK